MYIYIYIYIHIVNHCSTMSRFSILSKRDTRHAHAPLRLTSTHALLHALLGMSRAHYVIAILTIMSPFIIGM